MFEKYWRKGRKSVFCSAMKEQQYSELCKKDTTAVPLKKKKEKSDTHLNRHTRKSLNLFNMTKQQNIGHHTGTLQNCTQEDFTTRGRSCFTNVRKMLTGWLAGQLTGWLADWLTDWLPGWLTDWLTGWLAGCLAGWMPCWFTHWKTGWLSGCLAGWGLRERDDGRGSERRSAGVRDKLSRWKKRGICRKIERRGREEHID